LLRVLEEKEFQPLGSVEKCKTDTRIIAATHLDLEEKVADGSFRKDLFYRINIVRFTLPALRDRKEDLPLLVEHFIEKLNRIKGRFVANLSQEAMTQLLAHDFPGNIRELENIIEHGFVLCQEGEMGMQHLPGSLGDSSAEKISPSAGKIVQNLQVAEADLILDALKRCNYNRLAAAKELGMHKSTLFRKLKKYQIELPTLDGRSGRTTS